MAFPAGALAQRTLHWDNVDVAAHLDAEGRLLVTETQTMVFNGDWNGGERRFNIRPRQELQLLNLDRAEGDGWKPMVRDSSLDDWTSTRLPMRPAPGAAGCCGCDRCKTRLTYAFSTTLEHRLEDGDDYKRDHDFRFRIARFPPARGGARSIPSGNRITRPGRIPAEQLYRAGMVMTIRCVHVGV